VQSNQRLIFVFPFVLALGFALLYLFLPNIYLKIIREDKLVEDLQALSYFISSAIGFMAIVKLHKSPYKDITCILALFAISTLLIGLEEISWGQRILGIATPESFMDSNTQKELTVHNLYEVQKYTDLVYMIIGLYGGAAWFIRGDTLSNLRNIRNFIVPDWYCCFYFFPIAIYHFFYERTLKFELVQRIYFIHPQIAPWRHQEAVELFLAFGFLLVAVSNYQKVSKLINNYN
jgi:hypothetical protein